jgi:hypothetical protein
MRSDSPDHPTILCKCCLVLGIYGVPDSRLDDDTVLEAPATEHDGALDSRVIAQDVFQRARVGLRSEGRIE